MAVFFSTHEEPSTLPVKPNTKSLNEEQSYFRRREDKVIQPTLTGCLRAQYGASCHAGVFKKQN